MHSVETLSLIVKPHNEAITTSYATTVTVTDDGAGPYLNVAQEMNSGSIFIEPENWWPIKAAIDGLMCRLHLHAPIDPDEPEETPVYEIDASAIAN